MTDADQTVKSLPQCPVCSAVSTGPFCVRDGTIIDGPFGVDGRYLVEELLGGGGVSIVFGARHLVLGKPVALKMLRSELAGDAEQAQRFLREARNASQLNHENIVDITDFGHDKEARLIYLVMERLSGTTLDRALEPRMPLDRALRILLQLARAMVAAHAAGVVHRDIKPHNIFLINSSGRDDQVKLCDFGLSRLSDGQDRITVTGTMLGTPAYMAPEQVRGDAVQDHRVDIYGFGCTAYEILTGQIPHQAGTAGALLANKLTGYTLLSPSELVPEADLPPELDELIIRCLSSNPADRPASAADLEAIIGGLLSNTRTPFTPSSLIGQMVGSHRVTRWLGSGGIGSVYQGEHPLIGTQVAIKILRSEIANDPTMIERFVLEARASSSIGSPHIPRFLDFGYLPSGPPYAVMEYLDGETLGNRLRRLGLLPLEQALSILNQVASAMELAHAQGIVHRDLKPDNIFLTRAPLAAGERAPSVAGRDATGREVVKVLDFGIAKLMTSSGSAARTRAGLVLGTAYYCAPEQALGLEVGPTADVYALGVTAFEMLTGQPPFQGQVSAILGAKTTQDAPSIRILRPDLNTGIERGIAAMLAREPEDRMASMTKVLAELETWTREPAPADPIPLPVSTVGDVIAMVPRREPSAQRAAATITPSAPVVSANAAAWARRGLVATAIVAVVLVTLMIVRDREPVRKPSGGSAASPQLVRPAGSAATVTPDIARPAGPQIVVPDHRPLATGSTAGVTAPGSGASVTAPGSGASVGSGSSTPGAGSSAVASSDGSNGSGDGSGKSRRRTSDRDGHGRKSAPPTTGSKQSGSRDGVIFDPFKD